MKLCGVAIDSVEETPAGPALDAEITSNRPDCLGHYGIAREVATIYRLPLKPLQPKLKEIAEQVGFQTVHHFTRHFTAAEGSSPAAWRREYLGGIRKDVYINPKFENRILTVETQDVR